MKVIHSITPRYFKVADEVRTRCGKSANVHSAGVGAAHLIDEAGNQFYGSTRREAVTCKKCINLLTVGTIHGSDRAGPPTARNEPWPGPDSSPAITDPKQYTARDAAWEAWACHTLANEQELRFARAGFCAGWAARKEAELTLILTGASR